MTIYVEKKKNRQNYLILERSYLINQPYIEISVSNEPEFLCKQVRKVFLGKKTVEKVKCP